MRFELYSDVCGKIGISAAARFLIFILAVSVLPACSDSPTDEDGDPILGKWGNETTAFDFKADGRLIASEPGESHTLRWSRLENGMIEIEEVEGDTSNKSSLTVEIKGKTLKLSSGPDHELIMERDHPGPTESRNKDAVR